MFNHLHQEGTFYRKFLVEQIQEMLHCLCLVKEDNLPQAGLIFVVFVKPYGLKNTRFFLHFTREFHWSVLKQVWMKFLPVMGLQRTGPVLG